MSAENLKKIFKKKEKEHPEKAKEIAYDKAFSKAYAQGKKKGAISLLVHILQHKFEVDLISPSALRIIHSASFAKIKKWAVQDPEGKTLGEFLE